MMKNLDDYIGNHDIDDPVAAVLYDLRLSGSFYCRSEARAPWGLENPPQPCALFHFIVKGGCWLKTKGENPIYLNTGDLVLLPHGLGHQISDKPNRPMDSIESLARKKVGENSLVSSHGGEGELTLLICGGVLFQPPTHPLIALLPNAIFIHTDDIETHQWVQAILKLLEIEAASSRLGNETIITRLTDVLVIGAIRKWMESSETGQNGWVSALRDDYIGRSIALIHRKAEHPWTVASLAGEIGMSRSIFAERFTKMVGKSPMNYLKEWRMHLASVWLHQEKLSLSEVAYRLSYGSEAAFSRAFKQHWGVPPGTYRRQSASAIMQ